MKVKSIKNTEAKTKLIFVILVCAYRIMMDFIYRVEISPAYEYANMVFDQTITGGIVSWLLLALCTFLVLPCVTRKDVLIPNFVIILFFMRFVPITVMLSSMQLPSLYYAAQSVFWLLLFALLRAEKGINIGTIERSNVFVYILTAIMIFTVIFVSGRYTGFRLDLNFLRFDFTDVYDLRDDARGFSMPTIISYLWGATTNILPVLLVFFLEKKKRIIALLIFFVIILNFSIDGTKSTLFKLFLCIGFYYLLKGNPVKIVPYLFVVLCGIAIIEYVAFETIITSSLVIRRVCFVPALLDSFYFDFIYNHSPLYFQHTYQGTDLPFVIGANYYDMPDMRCNNGTFSDAYMNLGFVGCLIYPLLYSIILRLCTTAFKGLDISVVFYVSFLFVWNLMSSELTIALLTHGLFLLSFTLFIIPRKNTFNQLGNLQNNNL